MLLRKFIIYTDTRDKPTTYKLLKCVDCLYIISDFSIENLHLNVNFKDDFILGKFQFSKLKITENFKSFHK